MLGPAERKLYWKGIVKLRVERYDLNEGIALDSRLTKRLVNDRDAQAKALVKMAVYARVVPDGHVGLRAAVGTRKLDVLLEDKTAIDRDIADHLGKRFADIGLSVISVGVKDIILPGDMKDLLGKVVEAEKAAQANVIRRREETNATRSLLNTAKVMESNGVALRLKELETLEKVTENVGNLSVVGGLDALLNGLVNIKQ